MWLPGRTFNWPCNSTTYRPNKQQFRAKQLTLGVFIDFVDHKILLKKLEINGIVGKNLKWFKNYLNNRKQYIQINNEEKKLLLVKCGVT